MSSRLGIGERQEAVEEVAGVVRAGAGLGVVLDGRAGDVAQHQALDGAVVEVEVGQLGDAEVGLPADRLVALDPRLAARALDGEAVVLRGDVDPAAGQVLDRVVGAAMAEGQLVGLQADRAAEQLVAEADAEDRAACRSARGRCRRRSRGRAGSPGPLARKTRSGSSASTSSAELVQGSRVTRQPRSRSWRTMFILTPVSIPTTCGAVAVEADRLGGRDRAGEVGAVHRGLGVDPLARLGLGHLGREDAAAHRAAVADVADEGAGVDAADPGHAAVGEPVEPAALGAWRRPRRSWRRA